MMVDYTGRKIRINLSNGYVFTGKCISDDGMIITIIDIKNHEVEINRASMVSAEVLDGSY